MLTEVERLGREAETELREDWRVGYDDGQGGRPRSGGATLHYAYGYRSGLTDRHHGISYQVVQADRCELEAEP